MFTTRILLAIVVGGSCISAARAEPVTLNVRPGLWEMTVSGEGSEVPPIPPEALARMTPDQRARVQAALAAQTASAGKPHVHKSCVTAKSLQRGFDTGESNAQRKCTRTITSSSGSAMDGREECTGAVPVSGRFHAEAPDATTVNVTVELTIKTMTVKRVMHGKWIGADCGEYAHDNN